MKQKKIAIILGASGGIGKAIALKLNKVGFITILVGRNLKNLRAALKDFNKNAIVITADISKEKEVVSLMHKVVKKFGRIDVLVNSAGSWIFKKFEDTTRKDFEEMIDNNFKGAFYCMRECVNQMKKQPQGGQIININSTAAKIFLPSPNNLFRKSVYAAIHCATAQLARALQAEVYIEKGKIKIATVYTGLVFTDWELDISSGRRNPEAIKKHALKPEDIAHAVWMIVKQGKNSNIIEVTIQPIHNLI